MVKVKHHHIKNLIQVGKHPISIKWIKLYHKRGSAQNKAVQSEAAARNGNRSKDGEDEWVEQDEPGVYITLTSLPGGIIDLKRVRFSRKRFSEKQAEQWWAENRARVYQRYNVRVVDKSSIGVASDDLAQ
ncbi:putative brevis radix (BRX) domain-containing protein [Helianthus annuus]|nr:putative brevis radix (BRX) domain-containing protein [Helianthus annuus]